MPFLDLTLVRCASLVIIFGSLLFASVVPFRVLLLAGAALVYTLFEAGSLRHLGLKRVSLCSTLIWAISLAAAVIVFGQILELLIGVLFEVRSDLGDYGALAGNVEAALQLLAFALISAAIGEEILSRGFLLHQLTAILGEGAASRRVAIIIGGVVFGAAHFGQGPVGMLTTGLTGIIFGWVWFRSERNLWALMLAHALVDSFGIALLYLGLHL